MSMKISELQKMCKYILENYGDGEVGSLYIGKKGDKFYDPINDCNFSPEDETFTLIADKRLKDRRIDHKCLIGMKNHMKSKVKIIQKKMDL